MVAATRWDGNYPKADFTPKLPPPELPPEDDPIPLLAWVVIAVLIESAGIMLGIAMNIGWRIAEVLF